jgi:hypothetical protein
MPDSSLTGATSVSMLDQNIVTTIWGAAALSGILVSLMVPQAEQYYRNYALEGTEFAHMQAKRWIRYTRIMPLQSLSY